MEPKVREIYPGIFLLHLPLPMRPTIVNVYLVRGDDEWALLRHQNPVANIGKTLLVFDCDRSIHPYNPANPGAGSAPDRDSSYP